MVSPTGLLYMRVGCHSFYSISSLWRAFVVAGILLNGMVLNSCGFKPRAMDLLNITPEEAARRLMAVVTERGNALPEAKRAEFYSGVASWLSGGVYR